MNNKNLVEKQFKEVTNALRNGDYSSAPFPLLGDEAYYYLKGKAETLQWILEVVCYE